jgi:uncharacterized alkaline shock family protein YloU
MSIFDRIILTLYTFLMGVAAVLIIIVSVNFVPLDDFVAFAARIPGRWEYTVGGAVLLLVSVRLFVANWWSHSSSADLTLESEHEGQIHVSQKALEDYIASFSNEVFGVHSAKARIKMEDQKLAVRINASIEPGINIPDTTDEVRRTVKKNIKKVIGIEVSDVELYCKHIKAKEE